MTNCGFKKSKDNTRCMSERRDEEKKFPNQWQHSNKVHKSITLSTDILYEHKQSSDS